MWMLPFKLTAVSSIIFEVICTGYCFIYDVYPEPEAVFIMKGYIWNKFLSLSLSLSVCLCVCVCFCECLHSPTHEYLFLDVYNTHIHLFITLGHSALLGYTQQPAGQSTRERSGCLTVLGPTIDLFSSAVWHVNGSAVVWVSAVTCAWQAVAMLLASANSFIIRK